MTNINKKDPKDKQLNHNMFNSLSEKTTKCTIFVSYINHRVRVTLTMGQKPNNLGININTVLSSVSNFN